ncbi:MAG: diguanylate cyclase, partial [Sterolibacterium sp.]
HLMDCHISNYQDNQECSLDFRILRKNGEIRWIAHGCRPVHDKNGNFMGRRVSNRDITERKAIEAALYESEERFRLISTAAKDAIIIIGPTEEITYWNPAAETIFGYKADEVQGKPLHELLAPPRYQDNACSGYQHFSISGQGAVVGKTFEMSALGKSGKEFPVELSISAMLIKDRWHALGIIRDITERKAVEEQIRQLAYYDTLTNLPNRRLLLDRINQSLSQAIRHKRSMAVMFLDLDRFKDINDTLGHEVGDELLKAAASRLNSCVRTGDTVSRQGGDEFVIVLAEINQQQDAARVAEKIIDAFALPVMVNGNELTITTSIGIAVYAGNQADDTQELLRKADKAMYAVKEAGRNGYSFYQD